MKILKYILGGIAAIFLLVLLISLFLPKTYHLERSIELKAPAEEVFAYIGDLKRWPEWSPWFEMDPDMEVTYGATTTGIGGTYSWVGEIAGTGSMEISEFDAPRRVVFKMKFKGYEDNPSTASLTLSPAGDFQTLTWDFSGEFVGNPIQRYFGLMFEKLIGPQYETGLANIKALTEAD